MAFGLNGSAVLVPEAVEFVALLIRVEELEDSVRPGVNCVLGPVGCDGAPRG